MNNEINNINSNGQPNITPDANQMSTGQTEQINQAFVNPIPVNPTVQPQSVEQTMQSTMNANIQPQETSATVNVQPQNVNQAVQSMSTTVSQPQEANVDPMSAVANLNKDEAMEEALSHTTQYSPFEAPKQEVNQEVKKTSNKNAYIFIGIIFAIMLLFIIFLPQISNLFGWV